MTKKEELRVSKAILNFGPVEKVKQYTKHDRSVKDTSSVVVINTDCEGVCYKIYAWQKFQIMPERCQMQGHY